MGHNQRFPPSSWSRRGAELADAASGRYVEYVRVRDGKDRREKGDKPGNLPRPPGYFCAWSSARETSEDDYGLPQVGRIDALRLELDVKDDPKILHEK